MNLSKHSRQHETMQRRAFTAGLVEAPEASDFFLKYSKMTLMAQTIATRREPKARDPI